MNAVGKFLVVFGAAAAVSACAVSETRSRVAPDEIIDAGITGNPEIAGVEFTVVSQPRLADMNA